MSPPARIQALLARPGAWIEPFEGAYRLRLTSDRRRRPLLVLDEAQFQAVVRLSPLTARPQGGWRLKGTDDIPSSPPGRPGLIEGGRDVVGPDGRMTRRAANLGESPIAWLARRKDASGRPWLTPAEVAAGERLRLDAETALRGAALTQRWDASPRRGAGGGADMGPGERALAAQQRVRRALAAVPPSARAILDLVCVRGSSLQLAEQGLGLRRRQGKTALKLALADLARHYGV